MQNESPINIELIRVGLIYIKNDLKTNYDYDLKKLNSLK